VRIGLPTEVKAQEKRVALTPGAVAELIGLGHEVLVQTGAGAGIREDDDAYVAVGATIVADAAAVFAGAELVVKVKEPQPEERAMLRPGQTLFTYLHLAPDVAQTEDLLASGATCIAYETVTDAAGRLPLLAPMSQVAGRLSVQAGAHVLEAPQGGAGVLLGGVPGVAPAKVVVLGGGVVGVNAIEMAIGLGADVTVLDRDLGVLDRLEHRFGAALDTIYSTGHAVSDRVRTADLVIGAVLVRGARAPKLISAELVSEMKSGSVLVDVAIDQGGCFATSHATTHQDPTYVVDDVVHYCVANMPGGVPVTSSHALVNATLPFVVALAGGVEEALRTDAHLRNGLNVHAGMLTEPSVAQDQGREHVDPLTALDRVAVSA
jgi:alanine dehydrogenase